MSATPETRILFVDDEPLILELLQLTVEGTEGEWDSRFVESGEQALQLMEREQFSLVVSDMRMPRMTGSQLLNEVMKRYPATMRIILSGYPDRDEVMRCVGATHQFLAKPCEISAITATLKRMRGLRERLHSAEIRQLLAGRERLPSIPSIYFEILDALENPDCSIDAISELVSQDPGLTAKILQLVNSAFFGFAREVSSAREGVMLLGIGTIRSLALTTHLFGVFKGEGVCPVEQIWKHSMQVARAAREIVEIQCGDDTLSEEAFTAGMLHDIGKMILAEQMPEKYLELLQRAAKEKRPLTELEEETLGATHADIGAYLLDLWGLPVSLVEAVALHHHPLGATEMAFSPLTAVHVADHLVMMAAGNTGALDSLDALYLDRLGLGSRLQDWRAACADLCE
jgi:putative nucleotidyltransferase with HDIG domain